MAQHSLYGRRSWNRRICMSQREFFCERLGHLPFCVDRPFLGLPTVKFSCTKRSRLWKNTLVPSAGWPRSLFGLLSHGSIMQKVIWGLQWYSSLFPRSAWFMQSAHFWRTKKHNILFRISLLSWTAHHGLMLFLLTNSPQEALILFYKSEFLLTIEQSRSFVKIILAETCQISSTSILR